MAVNAFSSEYGSDVVSTYDIDKPEVLNTLFRSKGDQGVGFFRTIDSLGYKSAVSQTEYSHHEEDWIHQKFHSQGSSAGAADAPVSITIQAADLDSSGTKYYPRLWDMVLFPDDTVGQITAISGALPPVLTINPVTAGANIPATTAGQELIIFTAAYSEGSDQPASAFAGTYKYTNNTQIIKETMTVTGTEMTNAKWFDKMSDGKKLSAFYTKGSLDADYRMNLKIDGALLFGKKITSTHANFTDAATGRKQRATEGLIPYAKANGNTRTYTAGAFTIQKFNEASKLLDKEFAADHVAGFLGNDLFYDIEDALVDYLNNTNVSYVANDLFKGNKDLAVSVGFQSFKKASRTFSFKKLGILSHPELYGAVGYDYSGLGVLIPMAKKKDMKTQNEVPTFGCRYKQLGGYSRMMEVININGAGPGQKVTSKDVNNYNLRCDLGFEGAAGNQMIVWEQA